MKKGKIALITSSHSIWDDRIHYHMARSLSCYYEVLILSSTGTASKTAGSIHLQGFDGSAMSKKRKLHLFTAYLEQYRPSLIIASEPIAVLAGHHYRKGLKARVPVLYDITEWYPSKKQMGLVKGPKKIPVFLKLLLFNVYAASLCNGFIFGEYFKGIPFRLLFPFKSWKNISYYVDLKFIHYKKAVLHNNTLCLGYSGRISLEKGIKNVFEVVKAIREKKPELKIRLKLIGWFIHPRDEETFNSLLKAAGELEVEFLGRQDFERFSELLQDVNVLLDLRVCDLENNHSLPIKLFYYAACGRPVIYSNLKAIRKEAADVNRFGYLVEPSDASGIANHILNYTGNWELYETHALNARRLAEEKYNWQRIEPELIRFVEKFNRS